MMFDVWVDRPNMPLKVASADLFETAMYYAAQYREEGRVTVKKGKVIHAIMSETRTIINQVKGKPHAK